MLYNNHLSIFTECMSIEKKFVLTWNTKETLKQVIKYLVRPVSDGHVTLPVEVITLNNVWIVFIYSQLCGASLIKLDV